MASAVYRLLKKGKLEPLGAADWLHALKTRQFVLPNIHETGADGPLLHLVLKADRPHWRGFGAADAENFGYDRPHEALALWFLEQGADPWVRHNGTNAWSEALFRGWPELMAWLVRHPGSPGKQALQAEPVVSNLNSASSLPAPAAFAARGQDHALEAWAKLGLDINVGVKDGASAGAHATDPRMLTLWASLGGDLAAPWMGTPLPQAWSRFPAARRVAMTRVWDKYQPARVRSFRERIDTLLSGRPHESKTILLADLKRLDLRADSVDEDGTSLLDAWWQRFIQAPAQHDSYVVDHLLRAAAPERLRQALVLGLSALSSRGTYSHYPRLVHLSSALRSGRVGTLSQGLRSLAAALVDHPLALEQLVREGLDNAHRLDVPTVPEISGEKSYQANMRALVSFWADWFFQPTRQEPAGQGWRALASWLAAAPAGNPRESLTGRVLLGIIQGATPAQRQAGAQLLAMAAIRDHLKDSGQFPDRILEAWRQSTPWPNPWIELLPSLEPGNPGLSQETLEAGWQALEQACGGFSSKQVVLEQLRPVLDAARLNRQFPAGAPAHRARM